MYYSYAENKTSSTKYGCFELAIYETNGYKSLMLAVSAYYTEMFTVYYKAPKFQSFPQQIVLVVSAYYTLCLKKTSPTFLAITRESIDRFL